MGIIMLWIEKPCDMEAAKSMNLELNKGRELGPGVLVAMDQIIKAA
jgi:hypothetical protein